MKTLLCLQELDLRIEALRERELDIPKQKNKFDIHKERLADELAEREKIVQRLIIEQRECEVDIEARQVQVKKYDQQLYAVKKNEEYQALLHEIDTLKKQIAIREEREITVMVEIDDAKARLDEDRNRIEAELEEIKRQCVEIDVELTEAVVEREKLQGQREPIAAQVDPELLVRYTRVRTNRPTGPAVVPINGQACNGCFMRVTPQIFNEILAGAKIHACSHCGRLLYHPDNFAEEAEIV